MLKLSAFWRCRIELRVCRPRLGTNIATVNGKPIPQSLADSVANSMAKQQGQAVTPQLKEMVKNELISREVMVQEADKLGLDKETAVQDEIRIAQNILIRALFNAYLQKHPITDAQSRPNTTNSSRASAPPNTRRSTSWCRAKKKRRTSSPS
jgi:hypothetical protein